MEVVEEVQTKKRRTRKETKAAKAAATESQNTAVELLQDKFARDGVDTDESDEERQAPVKMATVFRRQMVVTEYKSLKKRFRPLSGAADESP
jgi:hypothetical protein